MNKNDFLQIRTLNDIYVRKNELRRDLKSQEEQLIMDWNAIKSQYAQLTTWQQNINHILSKQRLGLFSFFRLGIKTVQLMLHWFKR
ncbi:MAG: hypothetical protein J6V13_06625 [Paludibacteraceae bacterium]|nr:hypothetical protein [Paludibacteraceae bacterium]